MSILSSPSPHRPVSVTRAFTLIELLTVIAIIGILAAIIIPTVGKVRGMATSSQCASNLRQLGQQVALFANDNKGYLPAPGMYTQSQISDPRVLSGYNNLARLLWPYNSSAPIIATPTQTSVNIHDMLICPAVDKEFNVRSFPLTTLALSYIATEQSAALNDGSGNSVFVLGRPGAGSASIKSMNISKIEKYVFRGKSATLSSIWILQDADRSLLTGGGSQPTGPRAPQTGFLSASPSHGSGRNRVYLDGSVKRLSLKDSDS